MDRSTYMKMLYKYDDEYREKTLARSREYYRTHTEHMKKLCMEHYYKKKYGCTKEEFLARKEAQS